MSGTSLDGLDIAYCKFECGAYWRFEIIHFKTVAYEPIFQERLRKASKQTPDTIRTLSYDFGRFMAKEVQQFTQEYKITYLDLIASHGHTVFHQPEKGTTLQIGDPKPIHEAIGKPIVYDFRSGDIALGGQGAPLVPIVDELLFSEYDACLNLGGFSNISFDKGGSRVAFDICPVNIVLNLLSRKMGSDYDDKGVIARGAELEPELLDALNQIDYYRQDFPKSLAWEWVEEYILPVLENSAISTENQIRTMVEHIATQISSVVDSHQIESILVTGGGVYNDFLLERLNNFAPNLWVKGDRNLIEGKEAMAFALLGLLRCLNQINVRSSVTGSSEDHSTGVVYSDIES